MREDIKKTLCELQERAAKDIQKLLDAKTDFSVSEWKAASDAMDIIKDVEKSIKDATTTMAMEDEYGNEWDMGESKRGRMLDRYPMGDISYAGRRTGSMRSARHMGGSSYMGSSYSGASYAGEMDSAISNLQNLMNNAKTDNERMMYQRFIEEAERERYGR